MLSTIRKSAATVVALGALALGGATLAGAAGTSNSSGTDPSPRRGHEQREALAADVAAKVKAAAIEKVPGATVLETEAGGPYNSAYHAHIKTAGGTQQVVLVNSSFEATAVQADKGRGGRGHDGGRGGDETALSGDTKAKVEAAVRAKYSGATIERTETNHDSSAPYESHIKTSAGKELEVHVSKDFEVVDAREHPAHP